MNSWRGKWFVIEGPDRIGKTTLIHNLCRILEDYGLRVITNGFPRRTTLIGRLIDETLKNQRSLSGKTQTMLFLTDMLDDIKNIVEFLNEGGVVLTDRYVMSTYAYALAQYNDINEEWINQAISLLPSPNLYILLTPDKGSLDFLSMREGYGEDNTEQYSIQCRVLDNMLRFSYNHSNVINIIVSADSSPQTICDLFVLPRILNML
jgi:thymidylate kinase